MCVYVYMCIHAYVCICVYVYTCVYIHTYTYTHTYMYIHMHTYIKNYFPDPISKRLKRERLESEDGRQERQQSRQEVT